MGRIIRIEGLPDFNADDPAYKINKFEGWFDTPAPDVSLSPNGGGPGAIASGAWLPAEQYLVLTGRIQVPVEDLELQRSLLLRALPTNRTVPLVVLGNGLAPDKQIWVRRYDKPTIELLSRLDFVLPLVAPDPYRYGVVPVGGQLGVFTGENWYRTYAALAGSTSSGPDIYTDSYGAGGAWARQYAQVGGTGPWKRTYVQSDQVGPYPDTLSIESLGTVESRRVVTKVTGPLTEGSWWLQNLANGGKQWAQLTLGPTQMLILNTQDRTATVDGLDASHLVFGDWLTLTPGTNTFRLVAASRTDAFADIAALDAFE